MATLLKPDYGSLLMLKAKHLTMANFWCFGRRLLMAGRCLEIRLAAIIKTVIEVFSRLILAGAFRGSFLLT
jgi:hypothetical protein